MNVCSLDPLGLDFFFRRFPEYNSKGDLNVLIDKLEVAVSDKENVAALSIEESFAAMRDIGMIMSAIRRVGVQPCTLCEGLENLLLVLSDKTEMVPRETSYHYGPWNPRDHRVRRFTLLPDEMGLIEGVRIAIPGIEAAISGVDVLRKLSLRDEAFVDGCEQVVRNLHEAVRGIVETIRVTDPYVFSHELRPFFDPITVNGKDYVGAGGGQIPLFVIDIKVWMGNTVQLPEYAQFIRESLLYVPKKVRGSCVESMDKQSLVDIKLKELEEMDLRHVGVVIRSVEGIGLIINTLLKFRKPHFQLAERALSDENRGNYSTGSAGYRNSFNRLVLYGTMEAEERIKRAVNYLRGLA